jgi:type II secretory pathway component PulL
MSYPDPYGNPSRVRRNRRIALLFAAALLLLTLVFLKASHDKKVEAYSALSAARSAEAMLPSAPPKKPVAAVDPKQRAYLADLKSTALKLSVDWNTRIASVENALGSELSLNAVRVDGQKGEMELKGETSSNAKLTSIIAAMQSTGLDARIGRVARFQSGTTSGLEYAILIAWPQ